MNLSTYFADIADIAAGGRPIEVITSTRRILEKILKELAQPYKVRINGLHPLIEYYAEQTNMEKSQLDLLNEFRVFSNRVIHAQINNPSKNNACYCIKILAEFIAAVVQQEIPEKVSNFYAGETSFQPLYKRVSRTTYEEITEISGYIKSLTNKCKKDKFGRSYIDLSIMQEDAGLIEVRLTQLNAEDIIIELAETAWQLAEITLTDLQYHTENGYYYSTPKTLAILEPTYVIDVKQIADCNAFKSRGQWEIQPLLYQGKKFESVLTNEHIVKGYLLGKILDDMAINPAYSFINTADMFFKASPILAATLKNKMGLRIIDRIKIETQAQEKNIKNALTRFNNYKMSIEPTFLSVKYGIQGRLDALYTSKKNTNEKIVIELKSGNPAYYNPQHEMQTALYDLLLKSTYPGRFGSSYILYSKDNIEPLKFLFTAENIYFIQRKALQIRNHIIADEFALAEGKMDAVYESIGETGWGNIEHLYFNAFCQFICNEIKAGKEKHRNTLLASGESRSSKYLSNLAITSISNEFEIRFDLNPDRLLLFELPDFKENDFILVFPVEKDGNTNPLRHQILKSTISEIDDEHITISLVNKQINKDYFQQFKRWTICQDFREASLKKMYQQVYMLVTASPEKKKLLLTLEKQPVFKPVGYPPTGRLTAYQNEIVGKAISAMNYFLIQGPPGTGKTRYILTEIVSKLYETEKIVVTAYTNQAVNEICRELTVMNINFIQLGGKIGDEYSLHHISMNNKLDETLEQIAMAQVIVSTQHTLLSNMELLDTVTYKTLIVDEAAQLLEPQLVGIACRFDRFILIGDEKQLPAITLQEGIVETTDETLQSIHLRKLNESLFFRLLLNAKDKKWDCFAILKEQGRMHEELAAFPGREYYQDQLSTISILQKQPAQLFSRGADNYLERALAMKRLLFIPSSKSQEFFRNDAEQLFIKQFIETIQEVCSRKNIRIVKKSVGENELSIGVVTPYRKQISNIRRIIPASLKDLIIVDTIEKFQGSERDIIFYSAAVNHIRQVEKLQSLITIDGVEIDRKLNVALTRARKHLIIIGTLSVLQKNDQFKKLIEHIENEGGVIHL